MKQEEVGTHELKNAAACRTPWYRKLRFWILGVVLVGVPPILINLAYMCGRMLKEPNTFFSAGDVLSYYGTLLGAFATIVVLYVTISENQKTLKNSMKEQRIREKYGNEKNVANRILDVVLLKKYGDTLSLNNRSLMLFMQDLNEVYFETLARIPLNPGDQSNRAKFYRAIYNIHEMYINEIQKLDFSVPNNSSEAKENQLIIDGCVTKIMEIKNNKQTDFWFLAKGLDFDLNKQMNDEIDKIYGIKEATTDDKT